MLNCKDVIEKIWWAIPPVVIVFVFFPLVIIVIEGGCSFDKCVFWLQYLFFSPIGRIYVIFTFGFGGAGYYLVRKKKLSLRIVIPILLGIVGFVIGLFMALILAGSEGAY
uniref:Uncharacterized protein n=1 Tax=Candidatus Methanogaster sp. ANME-2c ERB4 TaxID=2759911 RepID=A0A7G9Y8Q9_9EURY|nr:hypothetical protein DGMLNGLO_00005 [Methanosarcinales archaeon ANME-2c ERB4]